jgi:Glycosyltransferase family 87
MMARLNPRLRLLAENRVIAAVYAVTTFVATWQKYPKGHDNNLRIFRASFFNLIAGRDLYALHPEQYFDYFKYSPTFALLMAPFAALPELASAMAWNFCNVFALFAAIRLLNFSREQKALALWLILIELVTSIENFQSNALVTAFIIATFIALERGRPEVAGFFVALGACIKIFGAAGMLLGLFYPRKVRFLSASMAATFLVIALPLLVTPMAQLQRQYMSWLFLLQNDYFAPEQLSIMSWLHAWFRINWPNSVVQIAGGCFLLLPVALTFLRRRNLDRVPMLVRERFRLIFLSSLLVFLVIFNHKAESPMFILAVAGVAIWYVTNAPSGWRSLLVALVFLVTSVASTDLVPRYWRETISTPMALKAVPCILAWIVMQAELLRFATRRVIVSPEAESKNLTR